MENAEVGIIENSGLPEHIVDNGKSKRQVTGLSHDSDPKVLAEGGELFETNSKPFSWPGF